MYFFLFWWGGVVSCFFTGWENAGMFENCRFMMDYEKQEKKEEENLQAEIHCLQNLYTVLSFRFHTIFFVCEYQLSELIPPEYLVTQNIHHKI
jgi:hypothetical protein